MRIILVGLLVSLFAAACSQPAVKSNVANSNAAVNSNTNSNAKKGMPKLATVAVDPAADSVYTDITDAVCKERDPSTYEAGSIMEADCPGTGGYKLVFSFSDHSAALSVIDPQAKETLLPLRSVLNPVMDFVVGNKVEWRMDKKGEGAKPLAMIVRANKIHRDDPSKDETFLIVTRLTSDMCVTDVVPASADQNKKARAFADTKGRPCMDVKSE